MTDRRTDPSLHDLNRGMLVAAAALVVVGGVLAAAGFALSAAAVVVAGRRWYRRADLTPNQLAKLKWEQARAAAGAGAAAWRDTEVAMYSPRSRAGS
jgi:membrane protein implicated in regulation of membrane protease activity